MINAHAQPAGYNRDYHPPSTSVTQRTRYKGALPGFGPRHTSMDSTVRPTADELDASHQKSPRHQSKFRQLVTAQWSRSGLGSKSGKNVSNGNTLVKAQPTSKYHSDQEAPVMQPTAPRNGRPISIAEPYYTSGSLVRSDPSLPLQGHREGILKTFTAPPADVQSTRDWAGENLQGGQVRVVPATGLTDITTYEGGLPPSARAPVDSGSGKGHLSGHRGTDPTIMPRSSGPAPLAPRTNGALQTPFGVKQDLPARQAPAALILDASLSSHKALKSFANHEAISKGSLANNVLTVTTVQVTTAGSPDALPFENDPGSYFPEEDRPRMELVTAAVANPMPPFCTRCEASGREWLAQQKDALNAELDEVLAGGIQEEEKRVAAEKKLDAAEKKLDAAEKQLEAQRQLASPESAPPAARVAELEQQVGELVAMLTQRVSPRESAGPGQSLLPDMEVRQQWMTLNWQIRQLVDPNIQLPGRFKDLSQSQLRYLTPAYGDFLRSKDKACLLAEAAIWYVLARYLFATIDKTSWAYWAGKSSAHLRTLADESFRKTEDIKEFHSWRCRTSAFFASIAEKNHVQAHTEEVVDRLEKHLKHVLVKEGLRQRLAKIVTLALDLDAGLCQQKASWFVWYPAASQDERYNMPFDPESMEVPKHLEPGAHVALMIAPALIKSGDSSGQHYDNWQPLCKSIVVCGPTTPPRSSSSAALAAKRSHVPGKTVSRTDLREGIGNVRGLIGGR